MDNCLLYDWLTFSASDYDVISILRFMGLPANLDWQTCLVSKLRYQNRNFFHGISIHWTDDIKSHYNRGVCVEMSGSGCRAYETFSGRSMQQLIDDCMSSGFHVSRVDIAFDDFSGVIDLEKMAYQARNFLFTSRLQKVSVLSESKISETEEAGVTVSHGSRSSRVFMRCYDKRYEKSAFEDFTHWVRFEIQFRDENAVGFIKYPAELGFKFSAIINNYLTYRDVPQRNDKGQFDQNKRRWPVSEWWLRFIGETERISVAEKKNEDYNIDRFREYIWSLRNVLKTILLIDGPVKFLNDIIAGSQTLPARYDQLLKDVGVHDLGEIQRFYDFFENEVVSCEKLKKN